MVKLLLLFAFTSHGTALKLALQNAAPEPNLLFGVMTSPQEPYTERLSAQMHTWMRDVTPQELVIVGKPAPKTDEGKRAQYVAADECEDNHEGGVSCKEMKLLEFAWKNDVDWVWVLGEDNYVLPDRAKKFLADYDPNRPQILGIVGCVTKKCKGMCGGAGELISRAALQHMFKKAQGNVSSFERTYKNAVEKCEGWCDQATSEVAKKAGVHLEMIDGVYGWPKKTYEIKRIIDGHHPILFHYVQPKQMLKVHKYAKKTPDTVDFARSDANALAIKKEYDAEVAAFLHRVNKKYAHINSDVYSVTADDDEA